MYSLRYFGLGGVSPQDFELSVLAVEAIQYKQKDARETYCVSYAAKKYENSILYN